MSILSEFFRRDRPLIDVWGEILRRGTEVVITAPTRNRMGLVKAYAGSNPALS